MICQMCEQHGGYEGEPEAEAHYLVRVTFPVAEAEANGPELLCEYHARQVAESYLGWGWGVHFDPVRITAWGARTSHLLDSGTTNEITGG